MSKKDFKKCKKYIFGVNVQRKDREIDCPCPLVVLLAAVERVEKLKNIKMIKYFIIIYHFKQFVKGRFHTWPPQDKVADGIAALHDRGFHHR